jgi:serine/threonine-protein kinase PknG
MSTARTCSRPGCHGRLDADGYCDVCGLRAVATVSAPSGRRRPGGSRSVGTLVTGSARAHGARRATSARTRSTSRRTAIGAGLVEVPPAPTIDPKTVVLSDPSVAENKRFCSSCNAPVGRGKGQGTSRTPGRLTGFCPACGHPFDLVPKLGPGNVVGGQYEVVGCLAHGGLGWIYLAKDQAVNDRWVVLKGLLDAGDAAAQAVAVAERRFLAEVQHPGIVGILNFVTHDGAGYIVEEYVGGRSLKQILQVRRAASGGTADPLPVDQAIAFVLAILPAFAHLHSRRLVYCDFKPDNLIQVGDHVKLIDLGAVRRLDDPYGDVYGTAGFQAPEIAEMGPSISSDLYTIGRTLAVLTLDFAHYTSTEQYSVPDPAEHPTLSEFDSFHRFLLKATAHHPDDRFQSVDELNDQLVGVLREVVTLTTGEPEPAPSSVFGPAPDEEAILPRLAVDAGDAAASFLANLSGVEPVGVLDEIRRAVQTSQVPLTAEVRLRVARAYIELGDTGRALAELGEIEADDPWEWRAAWLRGTLDLARGDLGSAATSFERCRAEVPGELAPKLAAGLVAERAGERAAAAALYAVVAGVDPSYVAAATGLARCLAGDGDVEGALAAVRRIPVTHRAYARAQVEAVRILSGAGRYDDASDLLTRLDVDEHLKAEMRVEMISQALGAFRTQNYPGGQLNGQPLTERLVRSELERSLRRLAELTDDVVRRCELVDEANRVRPFSLL